MIQNYNGPVNKAFVQELRGKCKGLAKLRADVFKRLKNAGRALDFHTNRDLLRYTNSFDVTSYLRSESDVHNFMKDAARYEIRLLCSQYSGADRDPFVKMLINFIIENGGYFPEPKTLTEMHGEAEHFRLNEGLDEGLEAIPGADDFTPLELIMFECLQFAEELMERVRETDSKAIHSPAFADPAYEYLPIHTDGLNITIERELETRPRDSTNYSITVSPIGEEFKFVEVCHYGGEPNSAYFSVRHYPRNYSHQPGDDEYALETIVKLHKALAKKAEEVGFQFISEVDYDNMPSKVYWD